jgi:serine/threonine protein kinase
MPLADGTKFADYTILQLLGSGGMGEVYLAKHPRLPRHDALKVLPEDVSADPDYRERFLREADLAAALWHPNIVGVHDRGQYEEQLWIAMDFVDGTDAAKLLAERYPAGMPEDLVVAIVSGVARGLDYAHKRGMLHRDVKPANVMLTHLDDESEQRDLLADFGIARNIEDISGLTTTNMTVGTVAYSAPEQLMGEPIDGRADQYALAATAYHLLTGSQLFPHSNPAVVISRHLNSSPPALADTRPELAALDPVLSAALAKDPTDRFARCSDFARALAEQSAVDSAPQPAAPTMPAPTPRRSQATQQVSGQTPPPELATAKGSRRRWLIPLAAAAVVVLVGAVGSVWRPWEQRSTTPSAGSSSATPSAPTSPPGPSLPPPPPPPPPSPAVFPASAIKNVLLTPTEIRTITDGEFHGPVPGTDMVVTNSSYGMSDNANQIDPPACAGVIFGADQSVYNDSGFEAIRDQTLDPSSYTIGNQVEQTAIVFPTAEKAQVVLTSQTKQWQACASRPNPYPPPTRGLQMGQRHGEGGLTWTLAEVQVGEDLIVVKMAGYDNEAGSDQVCEQALGVRANVLVKIRACDDISQSYRGNPVFTDTSMAGDYGERLANAILKRVTF